MSVKKPVIDLGYRKRTHVIAAIKGERRRRALGRLHPSFMGKDRIRYRVVDEYNGDTLSEKRTRSSKRPSSEVYPQFEAGIRARIDGWYAE